MSETTKRGVCKALGCEYDKCQWRDDGYGGGGGYSEEVSSAKYYTGGYNGGGGGGYNNGGSNYEGSNYGAYSGGGGYNNIKEYKTVIVKEDRADKYTGGEPIEEYQEEEQIEEYKEEEEEEEEEVEEVVKYDYKPPSQPSQPSWISSKVELVDPEPTEESYETACDDVSFFSDLSFALHVTLV